MSDYRLIPLKPLSKIAQVKWSNDNEYDLSDYPNCTGYGIDTGKSGLVIIDCDVKEDSNGIDNFFELLALEGQEFPNTLSVATPSGGLHFYFKSKSSKELKSSVSALAKNVDVRASGGYIVGPGSQVEISSGEVGNYVIDNEDASIAELPKWLEEKIIGHSSKNAESKNMKNSSRKSSSLGYQDAEKVNALNWAKEKMKNTQEGNRQNTLNKLAYFMGCKRVSSVEADELLEIALSVGMPIQEAQKTLKHGYEDGLKEPEMGFEQVITSYNSQTGVAAKDDPLDTGYYTHASLSYNFYATYSSDFMYWERQWYTYLENEGRWTPIDEEFINRKMAVYLDSLVNKIRAENPKLPANIYKLHEKLWLRPFIENVTGLAKYRYLRTEIDIFDQNPHLINCKNVVVDLRTGEELDHSRDYFFTKYISVNYISGKKDGFCDKVLESIPTESLDYMQLFAGQSLTGYQPKTQVALFLHGRGSNGKSTFLDLLLKTSGSYGELQPPGVLLSEKNGGDKFALADFEGLRTVVVEELPNSKILDTGALKRIVGTQRIKARRIYKAYHEFENQGTVFVSCNRLPMVNETDNGTWRRVLVIDFPYSYKKTKSQIVGEFDRLGDPRVLYSAQRKTSTAEAFLAWRVEGAKRWFNEGKAEYNVPQKIDSLTQEWNENNDIMLSWFKNNFDASVTNYFVTIEDLWHSYNDWAEGRGQSKISMRLFVENFTNHNVYYDNKLLYRKTSRVLKDLKRSEYWAPNGNYTPKKTADRPSYVIGLKFTK